MGLNDGDLLAGDLERWRSGEEDPVWGSGVSLEEGDLEDALGDLDPLVREGDLLRPLGGEVSRRKKV